MNARMKLSDGSSWPRPSLERDDEYGIAHRLIYGNPTQADLVEAASIIGAYGYLVVDASRQKRDLVVREIKAALRGEVA
jgi:hypothetical protein